MNININNIHLCLFMLHKYLDIIVKCKSAINPQGQGPNLIIYGIFTMLGT